jgi:hypothetical protein
MRRAWRIARLAGESAIIADPGQEDKIGAGARVANHAKNSFRFNAL